MGGDTSKPLPPLPGDNYMCITTFDSDSMLLYYVSQSEIEAIRNSICATWRKGISSEEYLCEEDKKNPKHKNCLKMKLNGRPWGNKTGEDQAIDMRLMVAAIIDSLHALGWKIIDNSDLYESVDLCFWMFSKCEANTETSFSVALSAKSKIQVINAPADVTAEVKKICEGEWSGGIESDETKENTTKIVLKGTPWNTKDQAEAVNARVLVAEIVKRMAARQYGLYSNANLRGTTDTLYFKHDPNVVDGCDMASMQVVTPDTIYFVKFPDSLCAAAREIITEFWPKGIQSEDNAGHEFKLTGRPFCRQIDRAYQDSVYARRMVTKLLEKFASLGYIVQTGMSLSRSESQKTNFLFRKSEPIQASFMCLSINWEDSVQLMCAPEDVCDKMAEVIKIWEKGESDRELTPYDGCQWQTKLKGCPWSIFDFMKASDGIYGQALLLQMLAAVQNCGWEFVCSGDLLYKYDGQKYKADYPADNIAWWFMKRQ